MINLLLTTKVFEGVSILVRCFCSENQNWFLQRSRVNLIHIFYLSNPTIFIQFQFKISLIVNSIVTNTFREYDMTFTVIDLTTYADDNEGFFLGLLGLIPRNLTLQELNKYTINH